MKDKTNLIPKLKAELKRVYLKLLKAQCLYYAQSSSKKKWEKACRLNRKLLELELEMKIEREDRKNTGKTGSL